MNNFMLSVTKKGARELNKKLMNDFKAGLINLEDAWDQYNKEMKDGKMIAIITTERENINTDFKNLVLKSLREHNLEQLRPEYDFKDMYTLKQLRKNLDEKDTYDVITDSSMIMNTRIVNICI